MRKLNLLSILFFLNSYVIGQGFTVSEIMYNSPGEDLEFLEFINTSDMPISLAGYEFDDGITYSFPDTVVAPSGFLVITNDSLKFQRFYEQSALEWESGSLSNGGEELLVLDVNGDTIIDLEYSDNQPWSQLADGGGASLTKCNLDGDPNLPESWDRSNAIPRIEENAFVYSDPGMHEGCTLNDSTRLVSGTLISREFEGSSFAIEYFLDNAPNQSSSFLVQTANLDGAEEGLDFNILTDTLNFSDARSSSQIVEIEILTDDLDEQVELFNVVLVPLDSDIQVEQDPVVIIQSCNAFTDSKLKLRGIVDSPEIKAVELFVLEDIMVNEFRSYGIGSANNGNGSSGQEYTLFSTASVPAGSCMFVTNDTIRFKQFFGPIDNSLLIQDEELEADYNGDDAIELFFNCQLVDTYGFPDVDGTGTEWEYTDGWARIMNGPITSRPSDFDPELWTYSGTEALDAATNDASSVPYPMECSLLLDSVEDEIESSVRIYPNPTDGKIVIDTDRKIDQLVIYNPLGQILFVTTNLDKETYLDLSDVNFNLGYMLFEIDEERFVKKVVKN